MEMTIEMLEEWRNLLIHSITIMDAGGRSNPEGNSKMLWNSSWNELRQNILGLVDKIDAFDKED